MVVDMNKKNLIMIGVVTCLGILIGTISDNASIVVFL